MTLEDAIIMHLNKIKIYEDMLKDDPYPDFQMMLDYNQSMFDWLVELKDLKASLNDTCVYIRELEAELKEAKRLLKLAMEDMNMLYESGKDEGCIGVAFKWRYADEAEKLIMQ